MDSFVPRTGHLLFAATLLYFSAGVVFYEPLWEYFFGSEKQATALSYQEERLYFAIFSSTCLEVVFWLSQLLVYLVMLNPASVEGVERIEKRHRKYPSDELLKKCLQDVLIGHAVRPFLLWVFYPLLKWRGIGLASSGAPPSVFVLLAQIFICVQVDDFLFYWVHRWFHENKFLYKHVHKQHHEFGYTVGLATEYAHPVEDFANFIPTIAGAFLLGAHASVLIGYVGLKLWQSVDAHSGYVMPFPLSPWNLLLGMDCSRAHDFHHSNNVGNYGGYFTFWDSVCGTDAAYKRHMGKNKHKTAKERPRGASSPNSGTGKVRISLLFFVIFAQGLYGLVSADGTSCLRNCNGHGECRNYQCHCDTGYIGEACEQFVGGSNSGDLVHPILSVGSYNLTQKNYTSTLRKLPLIFVGFSSHSCTKCVNVEGEYEHAMGTLTTLKVPLARVDSDHEDYIVSQYPPFQVPYIRVCRWGKCTNFDQPHTAKNIIAYAKKMAAVVSAPLNRVNTIENFLSETEDDPHACRVLTYFGTETERKRFGEEYEEYLEAANELKHISTLEFAEIDQIDGRSLSIFTFSKHPPYTMFNDAKDGTGVAKYKAPALSIRCGSGSSESLQLDEFYGGERISLRTWILSRSVPLLGPLDPVNFKTYENLHIPMFLTFLHLKPKKKKLKKKNKEVKKMLRALAKSYRGKVAFLTVDVLKYGDRMRRLGLFGGRAAAPCGALNVEDGGIRPFNQLETFSKSNVDHFINDFLGGRVPPSTSSEQHKAALAVTEHLRDVHTTQSRKSSKPSYPADGTRFKKGVRENFDDSVAYIQKLSMVDRSFTKIALNEVMDVVVLFHSTDGSCEKCEYLAPYYKKTARRFADLKINSIEIAEFDVAFEPPPFEVPNLPAIVLFRAHNSQPPYPFYSGAAKPSLLIRWIREHAGIKFELGELPQFDENEKELYKEQIKAFKLDQPIAPSGGIAGHGDEL
jgi:sterol desaturase/sphingolipid hydroxylase (fatty acid hydroxylase superfamily)